MKTPSVWLAFLLLSALLSTPALAQDEGIGIGPRQGSIFAEFSAARTGQGAGVIWGGSGGGYFQSGILGFVARATVLPGNYNLHTYSAVLGPRIAVSLPFVRAFVEAGGGMGRFDNYNATGTLGGSWGAAWQADAGVSHGILPRVDWRILEVAYGHIYAGSGVSPLVASTGLTLHIW
jgi:hypothetical protein